MPHPDNATPADVERWRKRMAAEPRRKALLQELINVQQPYFLGGSQEAKDMPDEVRQRARQIQAELDEIAYPDPA